MRLAAYAAARITITGLLAATAVAVFGASRVAAAEAYVCEAGRVVYVEFGDLERMKRTDACIARYYGLTAGPAGASAESQPRGANEPVAQAITERAAEVADPSVATEIPTAPPAPAARAAANPSKRASRGASPGRASAASVGARVTLPVRTLEFRRAGTQAPVAATPASVADTDYRNVRVINAGEASQQWFRHDM